MDSNATDSVVTNANIMLGQCTPETCSVLTSWYFYRIDLAANVAFLSLLSLSLLGYILVYACTRRAFGFTVAFVFGVTLEICGYIGRVMSYYDQWEQNGFLIQAICLILAPAPLAGGIYLCQRRIVYAFGPHNSLIKPESYTRIFIPCDLVSLLLQAGGGALAAGAFHKGESPVMGSYIMTAGVAFQILTMLTYMALCIDFAVRTYRRHSSMGADAFDSNPLFDKLRKDWKFKGFLASLALATICILWRSGYRVVELGQGWLGELTRNQPYLIGFDGFMVTLACLALNFFHPAICFKDGVTGAGGFGSSWRKSKEALGDKRSEGSSNSSISNSSSDDDEDKKGAIEYDGNTAGSSDEKKKEAVRVTVTEVTEVAEV